MTWVDVCPLKEFSNNSRKIVSLDDTDVIVIRINENFYAVNHMCTHADFPLDDAPIEDCQIECPLHGAKFSLITGEVTCPPAYEPLPIYKVRVHDGMVQVLE